MEPLIRDWTDFNDSNLLGVPSSKVTIISDYLRFCGVCSSWRSHALRIPKNLPPLLIIPFDRRPGAEDSEIRSFHDVSEKRMVDLNLPETVRLFCCGTNRGWLLHINKRTHPNRILNPLTRSVIELPPFAAEVTIGGANENAAPGVPGHYLGPYHGLNPIKEFCLSSKTTEPRCKIILLLARPCGIFCCEVGDQNWAIISPCQNSCGELMDVTPIKKRLLSTYKKHLVIVQNSMPEIVCHLGNLEDYRISLVEGDQGPYVITMIVLGE